MTDNSVNPHFLIHMTAASAAFEAEANEEIVAANAIKLLAKGSRIDASTCDRLLEHKLRKPLEDSVRVVGGVDERALAEAADRVLLTVSGGRRLRRSTASAPPPNWSMVSSARRCASCCIAWPRDMTTCSVPSPRPLPASKAQHSAWVT